MTQTHIQMNRDRVVGNHGPSVTSEDVMSALRDCYDPCCRDKGISVVDMGLIENVRVHDRSVEIDMLLTTGWCPFVANLFGMMTTRVKEIAGVDNVAVNVLWEPAWTIDRLSESARAKLTIPLEPLLPYRERRIAAEAAEAAVEAVKAVKAVKAVE